MMMTNTEYFTLPRHSFSKKLAEELTSATAVVMHASATTTPKITVPARPRSMSTMWMTNSARVIWMLNRPETVAPR